MSSIDLGEEAKRLQEATDAMVRQAAKPAKGEPTTAEEKQARKEAALPRIMPRKVILEIRATDPVTGQVTTHNLLSEILHDREPQAVANLAVDMAEGRPLDSFAAEDRETIRARALCFIQIRGRTPEVTRLLWEDMDFLAAVNAGCVYHRDTFRPSVLPPSHDGVAAGAGAKARSRVVVHDWRPADDVPAKQG